MVLEVVFVLLKLELELIVVVLQMKSQLVEKRNRMDLYGMLNLLLLLLTSNDRQRMDHHHLFDFDLFEN